MFSHPSIKTLGILLTLVMTAGCGGASEPAKPAVAITSLQDGGRVTAGQQVNIAYQASDVKGVVQIEITINGEPVHVEPVAPAVNVFSGSYIWVPQSPGSYLIQLITFNVDGAASDVTQVALTVEAGAAQQEDPAPTLAPTTTPEPETPTPPVPTATSTSTLASPTPEEPDPTPTATEASARPLVTMLMALNVRAGPGTGYEVVGRLAEGETAEITGRSESSGWWQIVFPAGPSGRGWVAVGQNFTTATNTGNVPVVSAPPLDEAGTSGDPTPANPNLPVIHQFSADRTAIAVGDSVILSWELENATEAFLRYNGTEEGVVSPGSKRVSPSSDTTYTLVARNAAGETRAEVSITTSGATPTPAPVVGSGTLSVANGQAIDFDTGLVRGDGTAGVDFFWDGQQLEFRSRNGAVGTLVNKAFGAITLIDCTSASYGAPIAGLDGSTPIIGCYKTNEARFGKFSISGWDTTRRLTIEWLTWAK